MSVTAWKGTATCAKVHLTFVEWFVTDSAPQNGLRIPFVHVKVDRNRLNVVAEGDFHVETPHICQLSPVPSLSSKIVRRAEHFVDVEYAAINVLFLGPGFHIEREIVQRL